MTAEYKNRPEVTMIMVASLNGIISRNEAESVSAWSSKEDQKHFKEIVREFDAVVMGRKSFKRECPGGKPHYILTRNDQKWGQTSQTVTHMGGTAAEVLETLNKQNALKVALLGGPYTNELFLREGLVDRALITVEPKMFGHGKGFIPEGSPLEVNFKIANVEILNDQGTLLLTCEFNRSSGGLYVPTTETTPQRHLELNQ